MLSIEEREELLTRIRENQLFMRSNEDTSHEKDRSLVVFTHGHNSKPADYADLLVDLMNDDEGPLTRCDLLPFKYRASVGANTDLKVAATELNQKIRQIHEERPYTKIFLVGHSLGGILIRQTVLEGYKGIVGPPTEQDWVSRVSRLVLLAAINRGIVLQKLHYKLAYRLGRLFNAGALIRDAQRGSTFMNNLRLGWIVKFQQADRQPPEIVQVLGDDDDTVGKFDSTDVQRFPNSHEEFLQHVGHTDFKGMTSAHSAYPKIRAAFTQPIPPHRTRPTLPEPDATSLVFLIHGIRDFGEWQSTLARTIREQNPSTKVVSVRYGYFNIFQFLLGFQRGRAVRSFVDRYIEEIANLTRNLDNVQISVAAHSNGTYVLANAMMQYDEIVFDRVYFAGCVLPGKGVWERLSQPQSDRLQVIRNDCANWDWPVGILCSALRWVGLHRSLGVAGYKGFTSEGTCVHNNMYLEGGHGAAFSPHLHEHIAQFLLTGKPKRLGSKQDEKKAMNLFFRIAPLLLLLVVAGLLSVYVALIPQLDSQPLEITASALFTLAIVLLLARI